MKLVIRFGKSDRLRFISHLDMQRTFQFALARSDLPIAYTQGFTPHPIMAFGSALAMGWTSEYEIFEARMAQDVTARQGLEAFSRALPPDIPVYEAITAENSRPSAMASAVWADYRVRLEDGACLAALGALLARKSVPAVRKSKSGEKEIDIRPLIASALADGNELTARLSAVQGDMLKPELLVRALSDMAGVPAPACRVHRTCLLGIGKEGAAVPLMRT